jgi:hypothetical protein
MHPQENRQITAGKATKSKQAKIQKKEGIKT